VRAVSGLCHLRRDWGPYFARGWRTCSLSGAGGLKTAARWTSPSRSAWTGEDHAGALGRWGRGDVATRRAKWPNRLSRNMRRLLSGTEDGLCQAPVGPNTPATAASLVAELSSAEGAAALAGIRLAHRA